jgi:hypothetical protein
MLSTVIKLVLNAVVAWIAGVLFITANLYFINNGADFTLIDLGFWGDHHRRVRSHDAASLLADAL